MTRRFSVAHFLKEKGSLRIDLRKFNEHFHAPAQKTVGSDEMEILSGENLEASVKYINELMPDQAVESVEEEPVDIGYVSDLYLNKYFDEYQPEPSPDINYILSSVTVMLTGQNRS